MNALPLLHDAGLLLLRLTVGGFLLPHGLGKLFGWFKGPGIPGFAVELHEHGLPSGTPLPVLLALAQTLPALLLVAGLCSRSAGLVAAGFLLVTAWLNRDGGWFWMHGGVEFPLLWALAALAVVLLGPGGWSLDAWWHARNGAGR